MNAPEDIATRFGSGRAVRRVEDPALVQGQGRYTDDVTPDGQLYVAFARSSVAHGRITAIDTAAASAVPGVVRVWTGAQLVADGIKPIPYGPGFARPDGKPMASPPRYPLAHEIVRYVGQPVAAVVAETRAAAKEAAAAVVVETAELPAVVDALAALRPGAPLVWPAAGDNVSAEKRHGDAAATAAAFERAAHVVRLDLVNQRVAAVPMEPRSVLAWIEDGRLVVRMSSQMPSGVRTSLATVLPGMPAEKIRVLVGDVGGGFGMKTGIYPEDVAVAWAACQLQRPVKWQAERLEDFLSAAAGRDQTSRAELALDADGKALALRVRTVANVGSLPSTAGAAIPLVVGPWVATSIYDIALVDFRLTAVLTNTAATGAYRGAGRPEAIYVIERLMDAAARELGVDPAELRRRNMIRREQMPYKNPMAQVYDSGDFESILDQGLALADWNGFAVRREESRARGRLRGRGIATFLEWTSGGAFEERVIVEVGADGSIDIHSATQAMGQGIATSYAQLAVDVFGVPIDRIRIHQGDTDVVNGFGSAGSRSLFVGGTSVRAAARQTVDKGRELAAAALEAPAADIEYAAGRYTVAGTDLGIGLAELAAREPAQRLVVDHTAGVRAPSWPNGCHVCEVEIDPETGRVEIVAYASVNDIGRIVSPAIVRGQVDGGAMQGIGQALCERVAYDGESGQLLSASLMDYALPHADVFHDFETTFDTSIPCLTNDLGAKGVGELGTIGATPAVVNAVVDALAAAGLGRDAEVQMPLTSEAIWRALHRREFPPVRWEG